MNYSNNPYDAVGVAMVKELYQQAESIAPISDEPASPKPALLKRLTGLVTRRVNATPAAPCADELPAVSASNGC